MYRNAEEDCNPVARYIPPVRRQQQQGLNAQGVDDDAQRIFHPRIYRQEPEVRRYPRWTLRRRIDETQIRDWFAKNPDDILSIVLEEAERLGELLSNDTSESVLLLLIKFFVKLCSVETYELLKQYALRCVILKSYRFIENVEVYIANYSEQPAYPRQANDFWLDLYTLCDNICIFDIKGDFSKLVECAATRICNIANISEATILKFDILKKKFAASKASKFEDDLGVNLNASQLETDFRKMKLYPYESEFISGPLPGMMQEFRNVDEYLEFHFRSLREDFANFMRRSIFDYKEKLQETDKPEYLPYLFVYHKVQFLRESLRGDYATGVKVKYGFETDNLGNVDYKKSSRLKVRSLVCFTNDHFRSCFLGIIMKTDENSSGEIIVDIVNRNPFAFDCDYVMAESEIYYEPYFQTLKSLQIIQELPMAQYIVHGETEIRRPAYINSDSVYTIRGRRFPVLDMNSWPDADDLGFDEDQYEAFRNALTQEFVIIQGNHGTGKTSVLLKITKTLIHNVPEKQILIVGLSNRAVDVLLEELLPFTDEIVRVGTQSKIEQLRHYNMSQHLQRNGCCKKSLKNLYRLIEEVSQEIDLIDSETDTTDREEELIVKRKSLIEQCDVLQKTLSELHLFRQAQLFRQMRVIGMTTTGSTARYSALKMLNAPIVILTEANEMLEANVIAALPPKCEHLILMGLNYKLDVEKIDFPLTMALAKNDRTKRFLFSRMVKAGILPTTLRYQHRMRPEIASLLVPLLYPEMINHPDVCDYPSVRGVEKNVFFVSHNEPEQFEEHSTSRKNVHEVAFLIELAKYFILQGYEPSDIMILSAHGGQLYAFQEAARESPSLKNVQFTRIQNVQECESKIILLSFVRSGTFSVKTAFFGYYVAVLISRAKEGLYMIGNMDVFTSAPSIWSHIKETLVKMDSFGKALPLKCQNHPDDVILVAKGEDFESVPSGKCLKCV